MDFSMKFGYGSQYTHMGIWKPKMSTNLKVALEKANENVSRNDNFVCSPLGIEVLLSMVAIGSSGETRKQILQFLGSENLEAIIMKASEIMRVVSPTIDGIQSKGPVISFVNGAWVHLQHSIRPSFSRLLKDTYGAVAAAIDFSKKEEVCKEVNSWASRSTQGLINEVLKPQQLTEDSMLILANALFFKATWEHQFTSIESRKFHLLTGETVEAPLMTHHNFRELEGACFDGFKLVKIPYNRVEGGRVFVMYMFLPDEKNGLVGLMQRFTKDPTFLERKFQLEIDVLSEFWIPKFKLSHDFFVGDTLKELGLDRMFMDVGELTEFVDDNSSKRLSFSNILQKSYIEVDEEGTKAASVTITGMFGCGPSLGTYIPRKKFRFVADHPFMFMIREETSGVTLFVGVVLK